MHPPFPRRTHLLLRPSSTQPQPGMILSLALPRFGPIHNVKQLCWPKLSLSPLPSLEEVLDHLLNELWLSWSCINVQNLVDTIRSKTLDISHIKNINASASTWLSEWLSCNGFFFFFKNAIKFFIPYDNIMFLYNFWSLICYIFASFLGKLGRGGTRWGGGPN